MCAVWFWVGMRTGQECGPRLSVGWRGWKIETKAMSSLGYAQVCLIYMAFFMLSVLAGWACSASL